MIGPAHFDPVTPSHAVERCGLSIAFREAFPEKTYKRARDQAAAQLQKAGLKQSVGQASGFNFDLATGKVSSIKGNFGAPILFSSADQTAQMIITPNTMSWQTTKYLRWSPFIGQFESTSSSLLEAYVDNLPLAFISLDYWDRFVWSGDWGDFSASDLLRSDSGMLPQQTSAFKREWHSHVGWFSIEGDLRRLTNVNIDVASVVSPLGEARPSVGIYTSLRDEPNAEGYPELDSETLDRGFIFKRLEELHLASKRSLSQIINPSMAERINLYPRKEL